MLCKYLRQNQVLFFQTFWNLFFPKCFRSTVGWIHGYRRLTALFPCPLLQAQGKSVQFNHSVMSDSWRPHGLGSGFPVNHQLPELAQSHVHQICYAIQPSHPLSSTSLPAFNLFQHQCLFQWVSSLNQVAKVLEFQLQHQSFQWIFRTGFL